MGRSADSPSSAGDVTSAQVDKLRTPQVTTDVVEKGNAEMQSQPSLQAKGLAAIRILMGSVFLYAGLDKTLFASGPFDASGFLKFATMGATATSAQGAIVNPTHDFWVSLAANAGAMQVINFLVPFGELAIGIALLLGLFTRFSALMGVIMVALFYVASWDFSVNYLNSDAVYVIATAIVGIFGAGEVWGLDGVLDKTAFMSRHPALHFATGLLG